MGDLAGFEHYYLHILGRKRSTAERHIGRLRSWELITDKSVDDIEPFDVLDYLEFNPPGHAGNTRKGMLTSIQCFARYRFARCQVDYTQDVRCRQICAIASPSITDEDSPPPLPLSHLKPLKDACQRPLEFRVVYGGSYLGLRIGESGRLEGKMWSDGIVWMKGEKNDRVRPIPVHRDLEPHMWTLLAHPPTDPSTMQRVKRRLEKRTGIRFKGHQLRKRFAQSLADGGVDKGTRADFLGHRTVDDIYATPNLNFLRNEMTKLDYSGTVVDLSARRSA